MFCGGISSEGIACGSTGGVIEKTPAMVVSLSWLLTLSNSLRKVSMNVGPDVVRGCFAFDKEGLKICPTTLSTIENIPFADGIGGWITLY